MPKYVLYTGEKKEKEKFSRLQIEVFFLPYISHPTPRPTPGFYGILIKTIYS